MDNPIRSSEAVELIMVARGSALLLPDGRIVIPSRLAVAVGKRAIALVAPKCSTGELLVKDTTLAVMSKKLKESAAASAVLTELIISGAVRTKGSRTSGGFLEDIPAYEYRGLVISGDDAVRVLNGKPKVFDVILDSMALAREIGILPPRSLASDVVVPPITAPGRLATVHPAPAVQSGLRQPQRRGGRKAAPYWGDMEKAAVAWLEENGCPAEGDGNQAELERHITKKLSDRDLHPDSSTVGRHVSAWVRARRGQIDQSKQAGA